MTPLIPCPSDDDPECISKVFELKTEAQRIKNEVSEGSLLPVEGFAQFLDLTMSKFDNDLGSTMWASTLIINGFDSSASLPVWAQANFEKNYGDQYFIGEDWLPYKDASCKNIKDYYGEGSSWVCSKQGDWKTEYWDNTANQGYHAWFSASTTFFDGLFWANLANNYHEGSHLEPIPSKGPPPKSGNTKEDYALSIKMMQLGYMLSLHYIDSMVYRAPGQCPPSNSTLPKNLQYVSPGNWIRANLKDH
jgi:hypothetical protein